MLDLGVSSAKAAARTMTLKDGNARPSTEGGRFSDTVDNLVLSAGGLGNHLLRSMAANTIVDNDSEIFTW